MLRAPLTRALARRFFSTTRAARGGDHLPPVDPAQFGNPNTFSGPFWRNMFVGSLGAFLLWQANKVYETTKDPDAIHPITAYISYHMTSEGEWKKANYDAIRTIEVGAADTLLLQELSGSPALPFVKAPELLERGSPFSNPISSQQADLSNLQLKR
ncbi:hypothetical protein AMAG_16384 [Allomyces macrogynus ATCC 38327]|uniref:Uncharacterized protein n=1 Tax=Allomyces macrogynus (strain ATCC 38327) TaxID=578462 RepID=A0A0L0TB79_ALLM3|nr:hypothetical protein AMAG_16384 [Allomyces macrogynus ATCC 38327]|eukprot:KNE71961.1 hypothetical protein AMAG_16384 [Allomyces macrogynus ATCC 38327]